MEFLISRRNIVSRISELQGMYNDVTKNSSDKATIMTVNSMISRTNLRFVQATFNGVVVFTGMQGVVVITGVF